MGEPPDNQGTRVLVLCTSKIWREGV